MATKSKVGGWIKMRVDLWGDPRISRLCDMAGAGEATVIGALYWLWATADQYADDGVLVDLTMNAIDRKTGVPGIAQALESIGWIEQYEDSSVMIVRFDEHGSTAAKKRAVTAKRMVNHRCDAGSVTQASHERHASVTPALQQRNESVTQASPNDNNSVTLASQQRHMSITDVLAQQKAPAPSVSVVNEDPAMAFARQQMDDAFN